MSLYNTQNKGKAAEAYRNRFEWCFHCEVRAMAFTAPHMLLRLPKQTTGLSMHFCTKMLTSPQRSDLYGAHKDFIRRTQGALSPGVQKPGTKLITHLYLVPRLRNSEAILPLLHMSQCRSPQLSTSTPSRVLNFGVRIIYTPISVQVYTIQQYT